MNHKAKLFLPVWFLLCLGMLGYFAKNGLNTFDHSGTLHALANEPGFDSAFAEVIQSNKQSLANSLVHFSTEGCMCQFNAKTHVLSVKALAEEKNLNNIEISLDDFGQDLSGYIPSVPAVALFDDVGELVYLGPYSSGVYCSPGNGLIEPFINKENQLFSMATLPLDAQGCYCATSNTA